ncbi:EAL domain-containing protein [Sphingomonas sp. 3-13AW]|uniref:EAL domain-containing protein n=1 Tax=Sphingomonas sp. 3-13AW TaxID=3050450 RepID=UPI003BB4A67B
MFQSSLVIRVIEILMRRSAMNMAIFTLACGVGVLAGLSDFGRPLESALEGVRQSTLSHHASGDVVIVAIDGRSMQEVSAWPWPRSVHARMVDVLHDAGAKKIAFDISFATPSPDPEQDQIFASALKRAGGKVVLPGVVTDAPSHRGRMGATTTMPTAQLAANATVANIYIRLDPDFYARSLPYAKIIGGQPRPTMASLVADRYGPVGKSFQLDWAINPETIPIYSYADVINGSVPKSDLKHKRIIIGATAETLGDRFTVPNYGRIPGVFLQAVGAETLLKHRPLEGGPWLLLLAFAFVLGIGSMLGRDGVLWFSIAASITGILITPYVLDTTTPLNVDMVPALLMTLSVGVMHSAYAAIRYIVTYLTRSSSSQLPNMLAMNLDDDSGSVVVVVRMRNYIAATTLLGVSARGELMRKMHHRLEMANNGEAIFQTDEQSFAWTTGRTVEEIADSIEGMYAIFSQGISIGDLTVDATIAVGICDDVTLGKEDAVAAATLAADQAAVRGLRWERYESERGDANWRLSLLSELDAAIDNGDVWVAYQPKYDLQSRKISGAEALVRWTHPERGFIAPDRFIPVVEEANRIEKLTLHVLRTAIRDFSDLEGSLTIAVNISARVLGKDQLHGPIREMLEAYGLPPSRLTLEITESAALAGETGVEELNRLREMGVAISIDDYGTGQSTLSYLKKLPATEIKIDRSFVQNVQTNRSDAAVVDSTIKLAHVLGMKVVAEGVENQEVLEILAGMECDVIQGYHISRPVCLNDFVSMPLVREVIPNGGKIRAA